MGPSAANTGPEGLWSPNAMSDSSLEFAQEHGLGSPLGRVRLGSGIPLADGSRARASLVLCASGLWLVAARDRFHGVHLDLLTHGDLRLVSGRLRDQLCFGQEQLIAQRRDAISRAVTPPRQLMPIDDRAKVIWIERNQLFRQRSALAQSYGPPVSIQRYDKIFSAQRLPRGRIRNILIRIRIFLDRLETAR